MKKEKIRQVVNKVLCKITEAVIYVTILCGVVGVVYIVGVFAISFFAAFNTEEIMLYKKNVYGIYNEGIKEMPYGSTILITTPNANDQDLVFNNGLKYVEYPDLMKIKIKTSYGKNIEYYGKNSEFKIKERVNYMLLKIKVDREHIEDIGYYQYERKVNIAKLIRHILLGAGILFLILHFGNILLEILENTEYNAKEDPKKKKK